MNTITIRRSFAVITIATIGATTAVASGNAAEGQTEPWPANGQNSQADPHAAVHASQIPRCFRVLLHTPSGPEEMVRCQRR